MSELATHPTRQTARIAGAAAFARELEFDALPDDVVRMASRCLIDLIGVAAAGARTPAAAIVNAYASTQMCGRDREARILFDGRRASLAGAAFAGAATIDSIDAHDGHVLTKGHAGVALLPALLAYVDGDIGERKRIDGREFIACLVLGYELATRAGIALHATTSDYHCSGAWNALGCAAVGGRLMDFDERRMREALGIAEYLGPRGQILRVCAQPSMLKDGSASGAHAGVTAALLAREGFTGAPALTVEADEVRPLWSDLGQRWRIREQYFKAYPVCRWAQPAVEAALSLKRAHRFDADDIVAIGIESFREAIDLGSQCRAPATTDEAQYSLPFPVAAALIFGRVGGAEIGAAGLSDPRIARLLATFSLSENDEFSSRFPAERWARVRIGLSDGRSLVSEPTQARGGAEHPLSDEEIAAKYRELAEPLLGTRRSSRIFALADSLPTEATALAPLIEELLSAAG
ncbi:MAG TPA: MmgE/PrpD family protein [Casimicrobiaceae bacterium]|jgi:2-methylcitrate dehydratase PrpD|nr:MmgE/PrpD family protein [Casimicrobiaceae bacterium]